MCSELFHSIGRKENTQYQGRTVGWVFPVDGSYIALNGSVK